MWKRRVYLILLGVALVGLIMAVCTQEREPGYGGKKLSEWVREYTAPGGQIAEADQAIASIGLKAIPRLVQWIGYEPPTNRRTTGLDQIRKILRDLTSGRWGSDPTETRLERANGAVLALIKLDPQGQASLRELSRLLNDPNAFYGAIRAVNTLFRLDSAGLPTLIAKLTNGPPELLALIANRICEMGNADKSLPVLLANPDPEIRRIATAKLMEMDPAALERPTR